VFSNQPIVTDASHEFQPNIDITSQAEDEYV
jgi:hypothetical protein